MTTPREIVSEEWGKAVKEFELRPGNITEKVIARIINRLDEAATAASLKDIPLLKQSDFAYFQCQECEFDSVQNASFKGAYYCPVCAGDTGREVRMGRRPATEEDKPEGFDARVLHGRQAGL
jgi:hypothetical protein